MLVTVLFIFITLIRAPVNPEARRALVSYLERHPLGHPRTIIHRLQNLDSTASLTDFKAIARQWRRNWHQNRERFASLSENVTTALEAEYAVSRVVGIRRAIEIDQRLTPPIGAEDVLTWFSTRNITESLREYARGIRRTLERHCQREILLSLRNMGHLDAFLEEFDDVV